MSQSIGRIGAITRKRKLMSDMEELKKELIDLQVLDDSQLYVKYMQNEGLGLDIATRPSDFKAYINNVSNGVTYFDNYMESLVEVSEIGNKMRELALQAENSDVLTADQQTYILAQYNALRTALLNITNGTFFNGKALYSPSTGTMTSPLAITYGRDSSGDNAVTYTPVRLLGDAITSTPPTPNI